MKQIVIHRKKKPLAETTETELAQTVTFLPGYTTYMLTAANILYWKEHDVLRFLYARSGPDEYGRERRREPGLTRALESKADYLPTLQNILCEQIQKPFDAVQGKEKHHRLLQCFSKEKMWLRVLD